MPRTNSELYIEIRRALREAGVEAYSLEARLIVATAAGVSPEALLRDMNLYTTEAVTAAARDFLRRRLAGEPVAYITGSWEFCGLPMVITPDVLIPRMDTEVVAETAVSLVKGRKNDARILDLCAGSGCIACAMLHELPAARAVLVDISRKALDVAKKNIELTGVRDRAISIEADVKQAPPIRLGSFDVIVSNPPYVPSGEIPGLDASVRDYEPTWALDGGADGLDFYRAILGPWKDLLRTASYLVFEVGETQAEDVMTLMRLAGFKGVESVLDTAGIRRAVFGRI